MCLIHEKSLAQLRDICTRLGLDQNPGNGGVAMQLVSNIFVAMKWCPGPLEEEESAGNEGDTAQQELDELETEDTIAVQPAAGGVGESSSSTLPTSSFSSLCASVWSVRLT